MQRLEVKDFLNHSKNTVIVDVRSPLEYQKGHIFNAVNIPVFSDNERAEVGTLYKLKGKQEAIEKGLEIVGPKLKEIALSAKKVSQNNELSVYCWRGGMRSEKMAWLFELTGLSCTVLEDGYKGFRNQLLKDFSDLKYLIVIVGSTGSGKTDILMALKEQGEQILDLEGLAHHKGSTFGALGQLPQPSTQQFHADLYHNLLQLDTEKRIWIESESLTIGKVCLPETLWASMNKACVLEIAVPQDARIERLVRDYGKFSYKELSNALFRIQRKFGGDKVRQCQQSLEKKDFRSVAINLLEYYDSAYAFSRVKYKKRNPTVIELSGKEMISDAKQILTLADKIIV